MPHIKCLPSSKRQILSVQTVDYTVLPTDKKLFNGCYLLCVQIQLFSTSDFVQAQSTFYENIFGAKQKINFEMEIFDFIVIVSYQLPILLIIIIIDSVSCSIGNIVDCAIHFQWEKQYLYLKVHTHNTK